MAIRYRIARDTDIPALSALMDAQYARKHAPEYFLWQYFASHYPTICVTSWDGKQLAGMFGVQKRSLSDGTIVGHLIDLLIAPEFRGHGIFSASCDLAVEHFGDLQALSVLPNLNGKNACVKSLNMLSIAKIDDLIRSKDSWPDSKHLPATTRISTVSVEFARSPDYRHWRFEQSPQYRYTEVGNAIVKTFKDPKTGEEFGDIVDWKKNPGPDDIISASNTLFSTGHRTISTWALPHTEMYAMLRNEGFEHKPRERYFCIKPLTPSAQHLQDITVWSLFPADAEIY